MYKPVIHGATSGHHIEENSLRVFREEKVSHTVRNWNGIQLLNKTQTAIRKSKDRKQWDPGTRDPHRRGAVGIPRAGLEESSR